MGFCMALGMNSMGIHLGNFGPTPDFQENLGLGVVSGDLRGQKAFAQIATSRAGGCIKEGRGIKFLPQGGFQHIRFSPPHQNSLTTHTSLIKGVEAHPVH